MPGLIYGVDDVATPTVKLVRLDGKGKRRYKTVRDWGPSNDENDVMAFTTKTGKLPSGTYRLQLRVKTYGHWDCSIYYEDGCKYENDSVEKYDWKFRYKAGTRKVVRPYFEPAMWLSGFKVTSTQTHVVLTGKITGRVEKRDFSLTPRKPLARRTVLLSGGYKKSDQKLVWRLLGETKTTRAGTFTLKFPIADDNPSLVEAQLAVTAAKGSPYAVWDIAGE